MPVQTLRKQFVVPKPQKWNWDKLGPDDAESGKLRCQESREQILAAERDVMERIRAKRVKLMERSPHAMLQEIMQFRRELDAMGKEGNQLARLRAEVTRAIEYIDREVEIRWR